MSGPRVLVVDDELPILRAVGTGLRARGYELITAQTAEDGLAKAVFDSPDVIVLDLGLPDVDGIEVCRRIREWSQVPIVVLSAHGSEARKVEALDEGADDFVTKPFGMAELEARLRVALRHRARQDGPEQPVIDLGPLHVNLATREVMVRGQSVELTRTEFDLLAFLGRHAGKVVTHRMLLEAVWGAEYTTETHYVRIYANHLRKKIEEDPTNPVLLRTSPGVGYQLVVPEDS